MDFATIRLGWTDRQEKKDYPDAYETWLTSKQIGYEIGRQLCAANSSILGYPGDRAIATLYSVGVSKGIVL